MMIKQELLEKANLVDEYLASLLVEDRPEHALLFKSMNYSLLAGGKRIRPSLFLMALEAMGIPLANYLPVAAAIECIHTYSLIHDDLPAMDDDSYRRGKLTNHMVFGAGVATMAGDGLLTEAFSLIADCAAVSAEITCSLISVLAKAAGPTGMVGGQVHDIDSEGHMLSLEELVILDYAKTGCLFAAPLEMAGIIGKVDADNIKHLHAIGMHMGLLFQITDDILDVKGTLAELGKEQNHDMQAKKATYVSIMGLSEAEVWAQREAKKIHTGILQIPREFSFLSDFTDLILNRNK